MSLRARGDHDGPLLRRWRPTQPGAGLTRRSGADAAPAPTDRVGDVTECAGTSRLTGMRSWRRPGRMVVWVLVAAVAAAGYASTRPAATRPGVYPRSPRAWFDAYMAAAVDDPARVCRVLFAPELAARYDHTRAGSCLAYFADVQDSAVRVRGLTTADSTAVVRLRQATAPRYAWSVVLGRRGGGWQAVALISGQ
jgi:hypothetical protein